MKYLWLALLISGSVSAQLAETIALQGVMQASDQQSVRDMNKALKMIKQMNQNQQDALNQINNMGNEAGNQRVKTGLVSKINSLKSDIYKKFHHNYQAINKQKLNQGYLRGYMWDVGPAGNGKYYIEIKNLNKNECQQITSGGVGGSALINNSFNVGCSDKNNVKLFF